MSPPSPCSQSGRHLMRPPLVPNATLKFDNACILSATRTPIHEVTALPCCRFKDRSYGRVLLLKLNYERIDGPCQWHEDPARRELHRGAAIGGVRCGRSMRRLHSGLEGREP